MVKTGLLLLLVLLSWELPEMGPPCSKCPCWGKLDLEVLLTPVCREWDRHHVPLGQTQVEGG